MARYSCKPTAFRRPPAAAAIYVPLLAAALAVVLLLIPITTYSQPVCSNRVWNEVDSGGVLPRLWAIHAASPQSVFVVGDGGTILHYDGTRWTRMDSGTDRAFYSVWAQADNDVWAVARRWEITEDGMYHYDGVSWSRVSGSPLGSNVMVSDGQVIVIGGTRVHRLVGDVWVEESAECNAEWCGMDAIIPKPGGGYYGAGYDGWDVGAFGSYWNDGEMYFGGSHPYEDLWLGPDSLYLVDNWGDIAVTDGNGDGGPFSQQPVSGAMGITGTAFPIVLTRDGHIAWFEGGTWQYSAQNIDTGSWHPNDELIWGTAPDTVYGITEFGIFQFDGSRFALYGPGAGPGVLDQTAAWVDEANQLWTTADSQVYRYDGSWWVRLMASDSPFNAIWGRSSTEVYTVDESGAVMRFDGAHWSATTLDADRLTDITGGDSGDVYAVGESGAGRAFRFDGAQWTMVGDLLPEPTAAIVSYPAGGGEMLLVGTVDGDLYRYDTGGWATIADVFQRGRPIRVLDLFQDNGQVLVSGEDHLVARVDARAGAVTGVDSLSVDLTSLWGAGWNSVWGASADGTGYFFDGSDWTVDGAISDGFATVAAIYGSAECDVFAVGSGGFVTRLSSADSTAGLYVQGLLGSPYILPGETVCVGAEVTPGRRFIEVDFQISGTNNEAGTGITDASGVAPFCYVPSMPGLDRVFADVRIGGASALNAIETIAVAPGYDPDSYQPGDTIATMVGSEIAASFLLDRRVPGVAVDFVVTGANAAAGSDTSDADGRATFRYTVGDGGVDTVTASIDHAFPGGPVVQSLPLDIYLDIPLVRLDARYHYSPEHRVGMPGDDYGVHIETVPAVPGDSLTVTVAGANPQTGGMRTRADGKGTWTYQMTNWGIDTIEISGGVGYRSYEKLVLYWYQPDIDVFSPTGKTSHVVIPGEDVCVRINADPRAGYSDVRVNVHGGNQVDTTIATNAYAMASWCYKPAYLGTDTITVSYVDTILTRTDELVYQLTHPVAALDTTRHSDTNQLLAVPGSQLCGGFVFDRPVTNQTVEFKSAGVNDRSSVVTVSGTDAEFCYNIDDVGIDTLTALSTFDFGGDSYGTSASMVFESYTPALAVDTMYHAYPETLLTNADGRTCAMFVTEPRIGNVDVTYRVTGSNAAEVYGWTDNVGRVSLCYDAPIAGTDTITAIGRFEIDGVPFDTEAKLVAVVADGAGRLPEITLDPAPGSSEYWLDIYLESDEQLSGASTTFNFERADGWRSTSPDVFELVENTTWTYRASWWVLDPGRLEALARATDGAGGVSFADVICDVARMWRGHSFDFRSNDGDVRMQASPESISLSGAMVARRVRISDSGPTDGGGNPLVPVSEQITLETNALLSSPVKLTLRYWHGAGSVADGDARKVGIYRRQSDHWAYAGGQGDGEYVSAKTELPGSYAAFFNAAHRIVPSTSVLHQNFPNPFNPATSIVYEIAQSGTTDLVVFDVAGRKVATLVSGELPAGIYQIDWDGRNDSGQTAASGVYFYRLRTGGSAQTKKMVLLR